MFRTNLKEDQAYIIGIDASLTATGVYACGMHPAIIDYYYEINSDATQRDFYRVQAIYDELIDDLQNLEHPIRMVVIEDYGPIGRFSGKLTQRAELCGLIKQYVLRELQIPYVTMPPKSLKNAATGNGNSGKEAMINQVYQSYGILMNSDNTADACHLANIGYSLHSGFKISQSFEKYLP